MELSSILFFIGGLAVILVGAELVLRGSAHIAAMLGVRPIIIGLTVVSVGTSAPELAVGITAVAQGVGELAVGNIAGTNMLNILFILGLSAAIRPLPLNLYSIRLDVPVMIGSALILVLFSLDGVLSQLEGIILFLGAIVYTIMLIRTSRRESAQMQKEFSEEYSTPKPGKKKNTGFFILNSVFVVGGITLTVLGANWLVDGAANIARALGVTEAVIGLTIVAIGTSAPELVTTIMATIKNDRDVAIGNLIGSSIYNILVILGLTCASFKKGVDVSDDVLMFDLPLAALAAAVCYPVFRSDHKVTRTEGILFVSAYLIYLSILIFVRA
jgi:cation:H+ antiporter